MVVEGTFGCCDKHFYLPILIGIGSIPHPVSVHPSADFASGSPLSKTVAIVAAASVCHETGFGIHVAQYPAVAALENPAEANASAILVATSLDLKSEEEPAPSESESSLTEVGVHPFERIDIMAVLETALMLVTPTANVRSKSSSPAIPIAAIFPKLRTVPALQKTWKRILPSLPS